ncbi:hypothetical protein PBI_BEAGLE_119 [Arthrobacter phage Beagle]|nr:hypothetical protein PBI_BEAGLE_119 [Arthrobacter phage Beagle]
MSKTEAYVATLPKCDLCRELGRTTDAHYDGKTKLGPWASMCDEHFEKFGIGLGTGVGQKYVVGEAPKVTEEERRQKVQEALRNNSMADLEDAVGDGDIADYL